MKIKKALYKIHLYIGLCAGIFLSIVGITGSIISYQNEILEFINKKSLYVVPQSQVKSLDSLIQIVAKKYPKRKVILVKLYKDKTRSFEAWTIGKKPKFMVVHIDQYSGKILPKYEYSELFFVVMNLHRNLTFGKIGKLLIGISTIVLVILSISGFILYFKFLRHNFLRAMSVSLKARGKMLYYKIHSAFGVWFLIPILLMSLTGLWWSFEWYNNALHVVFNVEKSAHHKRDMNIAPSSFSLDNAYDIFSSKVDFQSVRIRLPLNPKKQKFFYQCEDKSHPHDINTIIIDLNNNKILSHQLYKKLPLNRQIIKSMFAIHSGEYFGNIGRAIMFVSSFFVFVLFVSGFILFIKKRKFFQKNS